MSASPDGVEAVPVAGPRRWVAADPRAARWRNARAISRARAARRPGIPALDGLRAVAVALVLVSHGGIPGVAGGFIGVDIFFVLSGFLITSLLLDELGRTGRIDVVDFWSRRARRLLPALLVMVLAVAIGRELFPPDAIAGLRDDAVAAFVWVANWSFIAHKTDYFTQGGPPSPLQHTWSLGVEEQYYLAWPLLLIAVAVLLAAIARRRPATIRAARLTVFVLAAAIAAASAVWAIMLASGAAPDALRASGSSLPDALRASGSSLPDALRASGSSLLNRVYFGTDTRAQALLVGAAASALFVRDWSALVVGWSLIRARWVKWLARGLPLVGLAALGAGVHYATGSTAQFHRGLLIAVAFAAVAVVAPVALDQQGVVARLLALPPLVWLGTISYGVYLWHWPIFLAINGERTGWSGLPLFAVRCIATVGVATASWWVIEHPVRRWRPVRVPMLRLAVASVATAIAVTLAVVPVGTPRGMLPPGVATAAVMAPVPPVETLSPLSVPQQNGPRQHTVSVFGDSVAWTLMRYLPPTPGIKFIDNTTIGCGIVRGGPYRYQGETLDQKPECDAWPDRWAQRINYDRPDVVLLIIGRWETIDRVNEGHWTHIGHPAFDQYLTGELKHGLDILASTGARLVITTEPYNRRGERPDGSLYPEDDPDRVDEWNALLRRVAGDRPNITVLDLNKKLCPGGYYTAKVNGLPLRIDGVHPTPQAVKWLTPWLMDAVR